MTRGDQERQRHYRIAEAFDGNQLTLHFSGELAVDNLSLFRRDLNSIELIGATDSVSLDFSEVSYIDSAAALTILQFQKSLENRKTICRLANLNDKTSGLFNVIDEEALTKQPLKVEAPPDGIVLQIGDAVIRVVQDIQRFTLFSGELLYAVGITILHPRRLRTKDVLFYMNRTGVDGLPIIGLISLLIGLIIAFMSYLQLRFLGANIYVPSLVSFAMVRELGPIMTAILVAGRSGSAFAAEIASMSVNEEVAALNTMGFDALQFLALPKIIAAAIVVPILTLYADVFGVLGGLIVGVTGLDLTFHTYVVQSMNAVSVFDVVSSLIKAVVFAVLVAGIGCQRGFEAKTGAQDVGKVTTSAVVSGIFLIVVADSIFAIILYYIR